VIKILSLRKIFLTRMSDIKVPLGNGSGASRSRNLSIKMLILIIAFAGIVASIALNNHYADTNFGQTPSPVDWANAGEANYIISSWQSNNGTTLYGCYNTTSGSWIKSITSTVLSNVVNNASSAATNGTIVFAGNGVYILSSSIFTSGNGKVFDGNATLKLADGANCPIFEIRNNDTTIKNLILDMNNLKQTGGVGAINITQPSWNLAVDNITFQNCWQSGIHGVGSSSRNIVTNLTVTSCYANNIQGGTNHTGGVVYISYGSKVKVDGITAKHLGDGFDGSAFKLLDGVKVIYSSDVQVSNIHSYELAAHTIFIGFGTVNIQISNITMKNTLIKGLETVCVEFTSAGTQNTGTPNQNVVINDFQGSMGASGNSIIWVESAIGVTVNNGVCHVENTPMYTIHAYFGYDKDLVVKNLECDGYVARSSASVYFKNCSNVEASNINIRNQTNWNWSTSRKAPLCALEADYCNKIAISHSTISNVTRNGFYLISNKYVTIDYSSVIDCGTNSSGYAIYALDNNNLAITNNQFLRDISPNAKGIYLDVDKGADGCIIKFNEFAGISDYNALYQNGITSNLIVSENQGYQN
jgi:hypothetical protein